MGEYCQTSLVPVAVFSLLAAQEMRSGPTQVVGHMSFCKGMNQPLADLQFLQPETKETASEPFLWQTSEDLKHVRGRCTTGIDDKTHKNRLFISFL